MGPGYGGQAGVGGVGGVGVEVDVGMQGAVSASQLIRREGAGGDGFATDKRLVHGGSVAWGADRFAERALGAKKRADFRGECSLGARR
ncbi:hypothetical protein BST12_26605 [Mycobacterium angelicum]|uniref:Uncharacterized protein n=1 Tax=Mycobacterium angelicum TaxID=470074 RepID=A0A1W9ZB86_MYCAN|nr:hypothetical protein BST12_26605 [Mycobacterium angelicum]